MQFDYAGCGVLTVNDDDVQKSSVHLIALHLALFSSVQAPIWRQCLIAQFPISLLSDRDVGGLLSSLQPVYDRAMM